MYFTVRKKCQVAWCYASRNAKVKDCYGYRKGYSRFSWGKDLPFLQAVTSSSKRIADKGQTVAISTFVYRVPHFDKKELWDQAGKAFYLFLVVRLITCDLYHLHYICMIWIRSPSWIWVVGQEKTNGFWSVRIDLWVILAQRTGKKYLHASLNANKDILCLNEIFVCLFFPCNI